MDQAPPLLLPDSEEHKRKARFLLVSFVSLSGISATLLLSAMLRSDRENFTIHMIDYSYATFIYSLAAIVLLKTGSLTIPLLMGYTHLYPHAFVIALAEGLGIKSYIIPWVSLVPILAFFVLGNTAGVAATIAVFFEIVVLSWITFYLPPVDCKADGLAPGLLYNNPLGFCFNRSLYLFLICYVAYAYEASNAHTMDCLRKLLKQQEQLNARLRKATEAKTHFLASISHELRTPLNGIVGMTRLLQEQACATSADAPPVLTICTEHNSFFGSCEVQDALSLISECTDHLLSLVSDVLDFEKIEANKMELAQVPFDIIASTRTVCHIVELAAKKKGIEFRSFIDVDVPVHIGDSTRFNQILFNLLSNAIKFTPAGGSVSLQVMNNTEYDPSHICVEVVDTGIGISEEGQKRLFNRFEQVDNLIGKPLEGSGLGLAISKRLVELMGGTIGCRSKLGEGSTFYFTVTLPPAPIEVVKHCVHNVDAPPTGCVSGWTVLLVEDNVPNQKVMKKLLETAGCRVLVADNGKAGLDVFAREKEARCVSSHSVDVVLMDCQMPVMDGFEATRQIRQLENSKGWRRTPIIALTAAATLEYQRACEEVGMDGFVAKPVKKEVLLKAMLDANSKVKNKANQ